MYLRKHANRDDEEMTSVLYTLYWTVLLGPPSGKGVLLVEVLCLLYRQTTISGTVTQICGLQGVPQIPRRYKGTFVEMLQVDDDLSL